MRIWKISQLWWLPISLLPINFGHHPHRFKMSIIGLEKHHSDHCGEHLPSLTKQAAQRVCGNRKPYLSNQNFLDTKSRYCFGSLLSLETLFLVLEKTVSLQPSRSEIEKLTLMISQCIPDCEDFSSRAIKSRQFSPYDKNWTIWVRHCGLAE